MDTKELEKLWPQIACFYPFYSSDGGNNTMVLLQDGGQCLDRRKTKTFLQAMARIFAADLTALGQKYRDFLGHKGAVPLPLHGSLILVPFRVRRVQYKDHGATGYAVLDKVESVGPGNPEDPGGAASRISMMGGGVLECMEKTATVRKRLGEASQVRKEYSRFQRGRRTLTVPDLIREDLSGDDTSKVVYHIHYYAAGLPEGRGTVYKPEGIGGISLPRGYAGEKTPGS